MELCICNSGQHFGMWISFSLLSFPMISFDPVAIGGGDGGIHNQISRFRSTFAVQFNIK